MTVVCVSGADVYVAAVPTVLCGQSHLTSAFQMLPESLKKVSAIDVGSALYESLALVACGASTLSDLLSFKYHVVAVACGIGHDSKSLTHLGDAAPGTTPSAAPSSKRTCTRGSASYSARASSYDLPANLSGPKLAPSTPVMAFANSGATSFAAASDGTLRATYRSKNSVIRGKMLVLTSDSVCNPFTRYAYNCGADVN